MKVTNTYAYGIFTYVNLAAIAYTNALPLTKTSSNTDNAAPFAARIKGAGGGIPVVESGDCRLFDPEEEGKLQGTGQLFDRIHNRHAYQLPVSVSSNVDNAFAVTNVDAVELEDAQHWLEHLDSDLKTGSRTDPPLNFAKPQQPVTATVLGQARIIGEDAPGDIRHIVMKLPPGFHYVEGQSLSVIPPGVDSKTGKKHKPRLYSIASTRYGDLLDGNTVSLCVRRAEYYNPVTNLKDETKKGVCSNFLCDAEAGDQVQVAGPVGKTMRLPHDCNTDVIMVATGTGIAPFRGFLHRLFMEKTVAGHMFDATAWLILGVPVTSGLLYPEEINVMERNAQGKLKVDYAISREMKNAAGGKYYVQDVICENADEVFRRLDDGAHMFFCGLKGMMPSILEALEQVAKDRGIVWEDKLKELKANGQWHVEVY